MNDEALHQLIINMAHRGIARGEIVRSLVSQGHNTSDVERVFNELYYAGLLTRDTSVVLEQAGIKSVKDLLLQQTLPTTAQIPKTTRIRIWVKTHRRAAIAIGGGIVSLLVALGVGIGAYQTADTTQVNRALTSLSQVPVLAYKVATTTFSLPNSDTLTVSARGAVVSKPTPQASMDVFLQKNSLIPWQFTIVHDSHDTLYMYIAQGPLPYPFLYNRWIQFSTTPAEVHLLRAFGFSDAVLSLGIFHSFTQIDPLRAIQSFALAQTPYTNLSPFVSSASSCDREYKIIFQSNVLAPLMSTLLGSSVYTQYTPAQTPWRLCVVGGLISSVAIPVDALHGNPSPVVVTLYTATSTPSFSVDAITTPLSRVVEWAQEKNPGTVIP